MAAGSVEVASPTTSPALVRIGARWSRRRPRPDRRRARRPARRRRRGGRRPRPPSGAGADGRAGAPAGSGRWRRTRRPRRRCATTRCSNRGGSASGTRRRISSAASVSSVSSRQHAGGLDGAERGAPRRRGCRAPARRRRSRTRYRTWSSWFAPPVGLGAGAGPAGSGLGRAQRDVRGLAGSRAVGPVASPRQGLLAARRAALASR